MSNKKRITKAELCRKIDVSRPHFDKEFKDLLTDPEAAKIFGAYKKKFGFTPKQVDYLKDNIPSFNL